MIHVIRFIAIAVLIAGFGYDYSKTRLAASHNRHPVASIDPTGPIGPKPPSYAPIVVASPPVPQEQVITLPDDGRAYYIGVFLPDNWATDAKSRQLNSWFLSDPTLRSLRGQTIYNVVLQGSVEFQTKHSSIKKLPCVVLCDKEGNAYYKASGEGIPDTSRELAEAMTMQFRRCPNGRCPVQPPSPSPAPAPPVTPQPGPPGPPEVPDSSPPVAVPDDLIPESEDGLPAWMLFLMGVTGAGLAVGPDFAKKVRQM